jgi:L-ribulose-5-phosphate 3-epimerase
MNRRDFFAAAASAGVGSLLASEISAAETKPASARVKRIQLGIASYSYWHFRTEKVSIETVIEKAADLGVAGVDVLHRQMDLPERDPLTTGHRS